jgi:hypothetical protein
MEQRVVVEAVLLADALAVLEDLRAVHVLLGRHVAGLFQQRHVHIGRRVALSTRVPVPVPGAAEVATLLDDPYVVDPGLLEPGTRDEPGEAAADEGDGHVVGPGLALDPGQVRVVEVVGERPRHPQVLVVAVGAEPFVALVPVLLAQAVEVAQPVEVAQAVEVHD